MLAGPTQARAADYWVDPSGNDGSAGTATSPWATLQHAADTMQPGDTVTVDDGSYSGFWMKDRQGDTQHRFTLRSNSPLGAKITGPSPTASDPNDCVQLVSVSFATIDGFDVSGAPRAGISIRTFGDDTGADTTDDVVTNCRSHDNGAGVTAGRHDGIFTGFAQNVLLENNEVDHNSEHGIYVSNSADNPVIRGNRSHENTANGLQINADVSTGGDGVISNWLMENNIVWGNGGAAAINLDGATFGTLRNNLVFGNARGGIALFMGDAAEASHDNVVVDNTVYDPDGSRFAIQIDDGADNNVVFDNVFWSAASGMEIGSVNGLVHDYNAVSSYVGGSAGSHEITPAPTQLFASVSTNDYHAGPALVGGGVATLGGATVPATDLDGDARPQQGSVDIGCYQHQSVGSSSPDGGSGSPSSAGDGASDAGPGDGATDGPAWDSASDAASAVGAGKPTTNGSTAPDASGAGVVSSTDSGIDAAPTPGSSVSPPIVGVGDAGASAQSAEAGDADTPASNWGEDASNGRGGCNASSGRVTDFGALFLGIVVVGITRRRR